MAGHRLVATASLLLIVVAVVAAASVVGTAFPRGLLALLAVVLALGAALYGLVHRGAARVAGLGAALALVAAALALVVTIAPVRIAIAVGAAWLALMAARAAFRIHVALPAGPRPRRPFLLYNPRSGGGKAERFRVADEARAPVASGADALAMAGGDGSQAIVAAVAAEAGLPYACIPAGTRNHFALDLGVDRNDVVGALDALVDGGERIVDLAEVNGRVFVNNVSLGLYAVAVQREGYRDAKIRTLIDTVPDVVGPVAGALHLDWRGADGQAHGGGAAILVSNNRYRLGRAIGSGTRPRLDAGLLGVVTLLPDGSRPPSARPYAEWTTPSLEVTSGAPVAAGIDGEAVTLQTPVTFRTHPAALRCRIARAHPGASPSAFEPDTAAAAVRALVGMAVGRDPRPVGGAAGGASAPRRLPQ